MRPSGDANGFQGIAKITVSRIYLRAESGVPSPTNYSKIVLLESIASKAYRFTQAELPTVPGLGSQLSIESRTPVNYTTTSPTTIDVEGETFTLYDPELTNLSANTIYQAASDGVLSARVTFDNAPTHLFVFAGTQTQVQTQDGAALQCARTLEFVSGLTQRNLNCATVPVKSGQYYSIVVGNFHTAIDGRFQPLRSSSGGVILSNAAQTGTLPNMNGVMPGRGLLMGWAQVAADGQVSILCGPTLATQTPRCTVTTKYDDENIGCSAVIRQGEVCQLEATSGPGSGILSLHQFESSVVTVAQDNAELSIGIVYTATAPTYVSVSSNVDDGGSVQILTRDSPGDGFNQVCAGTDLLGGWRTCQYLVMPGKQYKLQVDRGLGAPRTLQTNLLLN